MENAAELMDTVNPEEADHSATKAEELDMDSLHILPLHQMPLESASLKRARLVKNIRLESMVELFNDESAGSGQIRAEDLGKVFNWPTNKTVPDDRLICLLCGLPSFDVYSLRIKLRELKIDVESNDYLKLSNSKNAELADSMKSFTLPLIEAVYGETSFEVNSLSDLVSLFAPSKKDEAMVNLKSLADRLQTSILEVPSYLEEYGDTFLSLAYFRDALDALVPQIIDFESSMDELMENHQLRKDRRLTHSIEFICDRVTTVTQSVLNRFNKFDRMSETMWQDLTARSFAETKAAIRENHVAIGSVICGLTVKMDGWQEKFGAGGNLMSRANFVMSDMMQGMELISAIEENTDVVNSKPAGWTQQAQVTIKPQDGWGDKRKLTGAENL